MTTNDQPAPFTTLIDDELRLYCAWGDAPTEADLAALETRLGRALPAPFRAFLGKYGGVLLEAREEAWPRPKPGAAGPAWTFQYAFLVFGSGRGIPRWLDLEAVTAKFRQENPESQDLLPFLQWIMSRDYLCFGRDGRIYEWTREAPFEPRLIEKPFEEVILDVTRALIEAKSRIKERGGA